MNALFRILIWWQLFFFFVTGSDSSTGSNETLSPSSCKLLNFWLVQIVRVFNCDGKFTPHSSSFWNLVLVQFLLLISIADFPLCDGLPFNSSSCQNLGLVQIVSVFNRDGKFSSFVSSFWNFVLVQFVLLSWIANFLPSSGLQIVVVEF